MQDPVSSTGAGAALEPAAPPVALARTLSLTHAVLYGLGVTIGAGIYVLVGPAVARAGDAAPLAFAVAAVLMGLTAASFAELGARLPVAAGEAAYVRAGFQRDSLATVTGLLVVAISIVAAAAISVGSAGYIQTVLPLPRAVIVAGVVLAMGAVAAMGVRESVSVAGAMTLIEVAGLVVVIIAGYFSGIHRGEAVALPIGPVVSATAAAGLISASMLAVFAFIGFESLANVAEELKEPRRDLPRAIFLTLVITTLLYILVVWVALRSATQAELAASAAPLTLVFQRVTGADPRIMTYIAIVATINGVIVQIILAARVLYGLSIQGGVHAVFAVLHPATRAPVNATMLTTFTVLLMALLLPLDRLADWSARLTLMLFAIVNAALIAIKLREETPPTGHFVVPMWVPCAGVVSTLAMILAEWLLG